ncbi:MAG: arginine deiminase family protein, partial [Candidatus Thorarchaeota archaeon]
MKIAIVRRPGKTFKRCLSQHPLHQTVDVGLALKQHSEYCQVLSELGLELIRLEPNDKHPDACFVEDTVVVHKGRAIITRMAKESRRGESQRVEEVLSEYKQIESVKEPGTLEGGDVIHLEDSLICGITDRTNHDGATQMEHWLQTYVHRMEDPTIMHIKSHVTYLGKDMIVCNPRYADDP